jgi:hypothetical protein
VALGVGKLISFVIYKAFVAGESMKKTWKVQAELCRAPGLLERNSLEVFAVFDACKRVPNTTLELSRLRYYRSLDNGI